MDAPEGAPFGSAMQDFVLAMIGREGLRPRPFGGRSEVLRGLDDWLSADAAEPCLFVEGLAGSGKSTLLAHWVRTLAVRADLRVLFIPISIRFGTNLLHDLFAAITAQLTSGTRRPAPSEAAGWRRLAFDALRSASAATRPTVLVIDGLDELADWRPAPDLLPLDLSTSLRVVISGRPLPKKGAESNWLDVLNWTQVGAARLLRLGNLSLAGVEDVLDRIGLSRETKLAEQLFEVTDGGDPLLVGLYARDIQQILLEGGDPAKALLDRPRGLKAYLDRWDEENRWLWSQRDGRPPPPPVDDILSLLACAHGPLGYAELASLAGSQLGAGGLDDAMQRLARLVSETPALGVTFAHSRFAEYFRARFERDGSALRAQQRFVAWGGETLGALSRRNIRPEQVSPYLVRYLGEHLREGDIPLQTLDALSSRAWFDAWQQRDRDPSGFLDDAWIPWERRRAATRASVRAAETPTGLADEVRCVLSMASVRSRQEAISVELVIALVAQGRWSPLHALEHVSSVEDTNTRLRGFELLVPALDHESVPTVLEFARRLPSVTERAQVVAVVAARLSATEQLATVLSTLEEVERNTSGLQKMILASVILPVLPEAERERGEAIAMEALFASPAVELLNLRQVVEALSVPARERVIRHLMDRIERGQDLGSMWLTVKSAFDLPDRDDVSDEDRPEVLRDLAAFLLLDAVADLMPPVLGPAALVAARGLKKEKHRGIALARLAHALPDDERAAVVREVLELLADPFFNEKRRAKALSILGPLLSPSDAADMLARRPAALLETFWRETLPALAAFVPPRAMLEVLSEMTGSASSRTRIESLVALLERDDPAVTPRVARDLLEVAALIDDKDLHERALDALCRAAPKSMLDDVRRRVTELRPSVARARLRARLADRLADGVQRVARETAFRECFAHIATTADVNVALEIVEGLTPRERAEAIDLLHARATSIADEASQVEALAAAIPWMPESERGRWWGSVLDRLKSATKSPRVVETIRAILPDLPDPLLGVLLREVLPSIDGPDEAEILGRVAERLTSELIPVALSRLHALGDPPEVAAALRSMIPRLAPTQLELAVEVARGLRLGRGGALALSEAIERQSDRGRRASIASLLATVDSGGALERAYLRHTDSALVRWWKDVVDWLARSSRGGSLQGWALPPPPAAVPPDGEPLEVWLSAVFACLPHLPPALVESLDEPLLDSLREFGRRGLRWQTLIAGAREVVASMPALWRQRIADDPGVLSAPLMALCQDMLRRYAPEILRFMVDGVEEDPEDKVRHYAKIAETMGSGALEITVRDTMTTVLRSHGRAVLNVIFAYLSPDRTSFEILIREFAEDVAFGIGWNWGRRALLQALIPYLSEWQLRLFYLDVRSSLGEESSLRALAAMSRYLPEDLVDDARCVLDMDVGPFRRIRILTALAPRLLEPERSARMEELLGLVLSQLDEMPSDVEKDGPVWFFGRLVAGDVGGLRAWGESFLWDLADIVPAMLASVVDPSTPLQSPEVPAPTLTALVQHAPVVCLPRVLEVLLKMSTKDGSLPILAMLVRRVAQLDREVQLATWETISARMSERDRPHALRLLRVATPLLATLGGPHTVLAAAEAVQQVGRWWP